MATQAQVADHLDMTRQKVGELVRRGIFASKGPGGLDVDECRVAYIRHLRARKAGWQGEDENGEVLDLTAERARKAKEEADRLEMQNAQMRGELVARGDVEAGVIGAFSRVRAKLIGLPAKVAPLVAAMTEPRECETAIRKPLYDALDELAGTSVHDLNRDFGAMLDGPEAAAGSDGERVGGSGAEA